MDHLIQTILYHKLSEHCWLFPFQLFKKASGTIHKNWKLGKRCFVYVAQIDNAKYYFAYKYPDDLLKFIFKVSSHSCF